MKDSKKIGIFTDSFFPTVGGTEYAVLGLTEALNKNHDAFVCAPGNSKMKNNYAFDVLRVKAFKAYDAYVALPKMDANIKKVLNDRPMDIIHCHSISGLANLGIAVAKKKNIPVVVTVHTKFREAFFSTLKSKLVVDLLIADMVKKLNKVDMVFTVSHDMKQELINYGVKKSITVVKNGCPKFAVPDKQTTAQSVNDLFNFAQDDFVCLYVGRIMDFKRILFSIEALKRVKQQGVRFKFLIVGDGDKLDEYRKYVKNQGLERDVIFSGKVEHNQLAPIYQRSNLFLLPSLFDNDPLTVIEASYCCVPSVTIKDSGASERIVDGVNGFTVENTLEAYVQKLQFLIANPEVVKQAGEQAYQTVPTTWDQTAEVYLSHYEECIQMKKAKDRN